MFDSLSEFIRLISVKELEEFANVQTDVERVYVFARSLSESIVIVNGTLYM